MNNNEIILNEVISVHKNLKEQVENFVFEDIKLFTKDDLLNIIGDMDSHWTIFRLLNQLKLIENNKNIATWNQIIQSDEKILWNSKDREMYHISENIKDSWSNYAQYAINILSLLAFDVKNIHLLQDSISN